MLISVRPCQHGVNPQVRGHVSRDREETDCSYQQCWNLPEHEGHKATVH